MVSKVKIWQVKGKELIPIEKKMADEKRKEPEDLEVWIRKTPEILGHNLLLIGEQVMTKGGPLDFLAVDDSGNTVIVELKRDLMPRVALTQCIDYASDISDWDYDELNTKCRKFTGKDLKDYIKKKFPIEDINWDDISLNQSQRILLVGVSISEKLERMITWLSDNYEVLINAIFMTYGKTKGGDEVIAATTIIPEEVEKEHSDKKTRKIWKTSLEDHYNRLYPPYNDYLKQIVEEIDIEPSYLSGSGFHLVNGSKKLIISTYIKSKLEFQFSKANKSSIMNLLKRLGVNFEIKDKSDNQSYKEPNPTPSIDYKQEYGSFEDMKRICKEWLELE